MTMRKTLAAGVLTGLLWGSTGWAGTGDIVIHRDGQADPVVIRTTDETNGPDNILDLGVPAGPPVHLTWDKPSYWYSADRTVFYLRGPVEFELPDVIASLDPKVRTLVLTSHGGYARPALEAATLIRQRGYTTSVPLYCHSACTFLFSAGVQRVADPRATFIVHAAVTDLEGIEDKAEIERYQRQDAALNGRLPLVLSGFGVDLAFIIDALRLPRRQDPRELDADTARGYGLATVVEKAMHNF